MKLNISPITLAIAVTLNTAWFVGESTRAVASERFGLTREQANRLVRDLAPPPFPNQWQQRVDRDIQCLLETNQASSASSCKTDASFQNNVNIQEELKQIPQLQLNTPNQPSLAR